LHCLSIFNNAASDKKILNTVLSYIYTDVFYNEKSFFSKEKNKKRYKRKNVTKIYKTETSAVYV